MEDGGCPAPADDDRQLAPAGLAGADQLRSELDALRRQLEEGERQLADLARQLADLTRAGAGAAVKRRELTRLGGRAREAVQAATDEPRQHKPEAGEAAAAAETPTEAEPAAAVPSAEDSDAPRGGASSSDDSAAEDDEEDSAGSEEDLDSELWQVKAGGATGGILVREGLDLSSNPAPERLAMGAVVRELYREGDRMQYELVSGAGPTTGWVTVKVKERELLAKRPPARTKSGYLKGPYSRLILWPRGRRQRPPKDPERKFRRVCVLGPFNSGTNAIMRELPRFFDVKVINKHRADYPAFWKHGIQKTGSKWPDDVFFICMTRDPGYWIKSLGRDPRDGTFNEFTPVWLMVGKNGRRRYEMQEPRTASQLFSEIDFDGKVYPNALAVWEFTLWSYLSGKMIPREQMVVLRYEDYVFRFKKAMKTLAQRGLILREDHPPFVAMQETAKDHTHPAKARRDLATTRRELEDDTQRFAGRTAEQVKQLLGMDPELLRLLGYGENAVSRWVS